MNETKYKNKLINNKPNHIEIPADCFTHSVFRSVHLWSLLFFDFFFALLLLLAAVLLTYWDKYTLQYIALLLTINVMHTLFFSSSSSSKFRSWTNFSCALCMSQRRTWLHMWKKCMHETARPKRKKVIHKSSLNQPGTKCMKEKRYSHNKIM